MSFSCPICFCTDVDAFVRLPHCGHAFCKACICEWMERQPSCPLCRDAVRAGERMEVEMHGVAVPRDSMGKDEMVTRLSTLFVDHEEYTYETGTPSLRTLLPIFLLIRHQGGVILSDPRFRACYEAKRREALKKFPELRRYRLREPSPPASRATGRGRARDECCRR